MSEYYSSQIGVVTFLDVLGWKGIWRRKDNAINELEQLVSNIEKDSATFERGISTKSTKTMIVSDTIVIFTPADKSNISKIIELHGRICQKAIPNSIKKGIPIRGAISFGDVVLSDKNNIFAGTAIDEAASWHEMSEWIGVFLTPSALFRYSFSDNNYLVKFKPPLKNNIDLDTFSVVWLDKEEMEMKINDVKNDLTKLAPIVPEIVIKFTNTIQFLEELKKRYEKESE